MEEPKEFISNIITIKRFLFIVVLMYILSIPSNPPIGLLADFVRKSVHVGEKNSTNAIN